MTGSLRLFSQENLSFQKENNAWNTFFVAGYARQVNAIRPLEARYCDSSHANVAPRVKPCREMGFPLKIDLDFPRNSPKLCLSPKTRSRVQRAGGSGNIFHSLLRLPTSPPADFSPPAVFSSPADFSSMQDLDALIGQHGSGEHARRDGGSRGIHAPETGNANPRLQARHFHAEQKRPEANLRRTSGA
jgi:hypothetical protein